MTKHFGEAPWFPPGHRDIERAVPRTDLQERLEGKIISGVYWLGPEDVPEGWAGAALEMTTSEVLFIFAAPVMELKYQTRLIFRWLEAQRQWSKRMRAIFGEGKDRATPKDEVQHKVQGHLVRLVHVERAALPDGGEGCSFEFSDGEGLRLEAHPSHENPLQCAVLKVEFVPRPPRTMFGPSGRPRPAVPI